MENTAPGK